MLACGALHESKANLKGVPAVLEKLLYTLSMEDVATSEHDICLTFKLTRVANGTKLVTSGEARFFFVAVWVKAWETIALFLDSVALMTTALDLFAALDDTFLIF